MAEIARLRAPAGPYLHLLDGAPADGRQLGWMLGEHEIISRALRGHCMRTEFALDDEIGAALQLPGDPIEDWESLAALLADLSWLPATGHALIVTRAGLLLAAEPDAFAPFCSAIGEVGRRRNGDIDVGSPRPFHVVLQDDPAGLAVLRVRLHAAGAEFDELLGWEPLEPAGSPSAAGIRTSWDPGDWRIDDVDRAAGAAIASRADVLEVRRAQERFRAGTETTVRFYGAVLRRFDRVGEVTAAMAEVVAEQGAQLMVMSEIAAARGPRQQAFLDASRAVWPEPEAGAEPAQEPSPDDGALGPAPSSTRAADTETDTADADAADAETDTADADTADAETADAIADVAALPTVAAGTTNADAPSESRAGLAQLPAGDVPSSRSDGGLDVGEFEIVAADLEWSFEPGSDRRDQADAGLAAVAAGDERVVGLWRCWCHDPSEDRWVRVVLGSVTGSPAEVDAVRGNVVDLLEAAGAARCCAEIVSSEDFGDVHRWLSDQSVPLLGPGTSVDAVAEAPEVDEPAPGATEPAAPRPDATELFSADATFEPGPAEPGEAADRLIAWASERAGVTGLVCAYSGDGADRVLLYGVVAERADDVADLRREAAGLIADTDGPHGVVAFSPTAKLPPALLRLYRSATRLWRPKVERAPSAAGGLAPIPGIGKTPQIITTEAREDETLDNGVTLVVLDGRTLDVDGGAEEANDVESDVVARTQTREHVIAVLSGTARFGGESLAVYLLMIDEPGTEPDVRAAVADMLAERAVTRAVVEVFCPFGGGIDTLHTLLAGRLRLRWKTGRIIDPDAAGTDAAADGPERPAGNPPC